MDFLSHKREMSRLFFGFILILVHRTLCYEQEAVEKGMDILYILYIQYKPPLWKAGDKSYQRLPRSNGRTVAESFKDMYEIRKEHHIWVKAYMYFIIEFQITIQMMFLKQ